MASHRSPRPLTRRQALAAAGVAGAAALLGCGGDAGGGDRRRDTTGAATPAGNWGSCVLTREATEGPYYLDFDRVRSDITEDREGTAMQLDFTVQDAATCEPIPGATVEIWHADATGAYSGFEAGGSSASSTFLRGGQQTDRSGRASFRTIYPGWYQGRAPHIHVKVHVEGDEVHTGQVFSPDELSAAVYRRGDYADRGAQYMTNDSDGIFASVGGDRAIPKLRRSAGGYTGELTLGVNA